jgi:hypothetical protein
MTEQRPERTDEAQRAYEAYALAVGQVAYTWNFLQDKLGQLFVAVTDINDRIALSIWYSSDNDRVQRGMLKAAIVASKDDRWLPRLPNAKDDLIWVIERANAWANDRNNSIHAPTTMATIDSTMEMTASLAGYINGHPRARNLWGKRLLIEFARCAAVAETLSDFADKAALALRDDTKPWPDRPSQLTHGQKTSPQAQPRPPRPKSRQRQPRSSQE